MSSDWPVRVFGQPLVQPDQRSCGAAVLVVARMLADHGYGREVAAAESVTARFREEVLATHRRVTAPVEGGRLQVPWPRALGTPPSLEVRKRVERLMRRQPPLVANVSASITLAPR